jgi:hypothetical protein
MSVVDAPAALPEPQAVAVPAALLARLVALSGHVQVRVDPVDQIRRRQYTTSRAVTYVCAADCPACAGQALLQPPPQEANHG